MREREKTIKKQKKNSLRSRTAGMTANCKSIVLLVSDGDPNDKSGWKKAKGVSGSRMDELVKDAEDSG